MTPTNHDASKVLLGSVGSSEQDSTEILGDPTVVKAGFACKRDSNGEAQKGGTAGAYLGVSLGASLNDDDKISVCRNGLKVPVRLKDDNVFASIKKGDITFTSKLRGTAGNAITVALTDTEDAGEESVTVDGTDIVIGAESTVSTAQEIVDALEASEDAMALIGAAIDTGDEAAAQTAFAEDNLESGVDAFAWVVVGDPVELDTDTGEAVENDEATGGVYASGVKSGIDPTTGDFEAYVALVDMTGGL